VLLLHEALIGTFFKPVTSVAGFFIGNLRIVSDTVSLRRMDLKRTADHSVMKTLAVFLTTCIIAAWIAAIAILSVQNFTPVTFQFFTFQSIQIPVGIVLAFAVGLGAVGMALLQLVLGIGSGGRYEEE
jgi:uncharacterized integral membrane protein